MAQFLSELRQSRAGQMGLGQTPNFELVMSWHVLQQVGLPKGSAGVRHSNEWARIHGFSNVCKKRKDNEFQENCGPKPGENTLPSTAMTSTAVCPMQCFRFCLYNVWQNFIVALNGGHQLALASLP
jgi:hypothetical protein